MLRVERGDVGQEHGSIAEVFGYGGVIADAADGGEIEGRLLLEELQRGLELAVDEDQLRFVPFRVELHLGLKCQQAHPLGAPPRGRERLRRNAGLLRRHFGLRLGRFL